MNLTLPDEMQRFVDAKLKAGEYDSAEQLIIAAVATMRQQERLDDLDLGELNRLLAEGDADIAAGRHRDGEEVYREMLEMSAARRREKSA